MKIYHLATLERPPNSFVILGTSHYYLSDMFFSSDEIAPVLDLSLKNDILDVYTLSVYQYAGLGNLYEYAHR
jgi:hypothetical protein